MLVRNLLKAGQRFDGRKIEETRALGIEQLKNSSLLKMGKSQLLVVFQKAMTKPYPDKPQEGVVNFNVSFGIRKYDKIANLLHRVYIKQKCIDLEKLCVRFGEEVVLIHVDLRFLSCDEGIYALAIAGVNSVLEALDVSLNFTPRCFFYCSVDRVIISDPTEYEMEENEWSCFVVVRSRREIILLEKIGGECSIEDSLEVVERSLRNYDT